MGTELPDRKGNRLKGYDYSARGVYFVTICTQNRVCNLGSVVGADARIGPHDGLNPDVHIELSPLGRIAEQALLQMDGLLHYVIMPNHIHFLVGIQPKADGTMQASSPTNGFLGSQPLTAGSGDPALLGYTHFSTCDWAGVLRFLHYYTTHLPKRPAAAKRSRGPCMLVDSHAAAITSSCGRYEQ